MSHASVFLISMLTSQQRALGTNLYLECQFFKRLKVADSLQEYLLLPSQFFTQKYTLVWHTHSHSLISSALTHACETNYQLSFLVKKIQIIIIESRWCGSVWALRGAHCRTFVPEWGPVLRGEVGTPWSQLAADNKAAWTVLSYGSQHQAQVGKMPESLYKGPKIMKSDIFSLQKAVLTRSLAYEVVRCEC